MVHLTAALSERKTEQVPFQWLGNLSLEQSASLHHIGKGASTCDCRDG